MAEYCQVKIERERGEDKLYTEKVERLFSPETYWKSRKTKNYTVNSDSYTVKKLLQKKRSSGARPKLSRLRVTTGKLASTARGKSLREGTHL